MNNEKIKILAVDDKADNLISLKALIAESFPEAEVITAANGHDGLKLATSHTPDLVLLDLLLPDKDGLEVCRCLKADKNLSEIPVVFLTALKADRQSRIRALEAGAEGFLSKPVDDIELQAQIKAMIKLRKANAFRSKESARLTSFLEEKTIQLEQVHAVHEQTKQNLELAGKQFQQLLETLPVSLIIVATDGRVKYVNPRCRELFEIPDDASFDQASVWPHWVDSGDKKRWLETMAQSGQVQNFEMRLKTFSDKEIWVLGSGLFIQFDGETCVLSSQHDITSLKKMQESLTESESRFRSYVESAPDAVFVAGNDGKYIEVNSAAAAMYACEKEDLIGRHITEFIHPDDLPIATMHFEAVKSKGQATAEVRIIRFDDEVRFKFVKAIKLSEEVLIGFSSDITQQKLAEKEIQEQNKRLATLLLSSRALTESLSQEGFMQKIASQASQAIDADSAAIYLLNDAKLKLEATVPPLPEFFSDEMRFAETHHHPHITEALTTGRPVIIHDTQTEQLTAAERAIVEIRELRKILYIPILLESLPLGILILGAKTINKVFGKAEINLLTAFAHQAAIAIRTNKMLAELRDSEERFKALHNASFGGIGVHDKGKIITCNQGLADMTGYTVDELTGMNGLLLISESHRDAVFNKIITGYEKPYEAVCVRKNGAEFPIQIEARNIPYRGKMVRVTEFRDLSEQKQAESIRQIQLNIAQASLNATEIGDLAGHIKEELSKLMKATNFIIAVYDAETDMLRSLVYDDEKDNYNEWPAAQSLSGQVVKSGKKLFLSKKEIEAYAKEHNLNVVGTPAECWLGVPITAFGDVIGVLVVQSYSNPVAYNVADVALIEMIAHETGLFIGRKKMLDDLVIARDNAEAANRLKTEFLNNISHEIRTPLNGIIGFGQMLALGTIPEKERKEYLRLLEQSSERIIKTMGDYMDASLITSRSLIRQFTDFDLNQFTDELFAYLQKTNTNPEISLRLRKPESEARITITGDREYLFRALRHLLDNAVKYTQHGSIEFGYNLRGRETEFFVKDTGKGIAKQVQAKIFNPFVQADRESTRSYEGNGLGLTIARGFFEHHKGRIEVVSEPGKGSTFFAYLPGFDFIVPFKEPLFDEPAFNQRPLILIAEDEFVNFQYIELLLRRAEVDYLHAPNGAVAVKLVEENPHTSIILMDIKMPVMNGLEATRLIKAQHPEIPIIAITAFALSGDERKILEAGCNDYMAKPFRHEDLRRKLKSYGIVI